MTKLALPSLIDVVFVVVILIPGFISLVLFRWITVYKRKISDNQLILWSLVCSLFIYTIFSYITRISDIDKIRDIIFEPKYLIFILSLGAVIGLVPGTFIWFRFRRNMVTGDCWEVSMKIASKEGSWIIVYTDDGREYKGTLHYSGSADEPREISIRQPKMIIRNDKGDVVKELKIGKEIFFSEDDIKRIVFFKEV